jgi:hypothetical protein
VMEQMKKLSWKGNQDNDSAWKDPGKKEMTNWPIFLLRWSNEGTRKFGIARWYILKPKIPVWVNFRGPWNGHFMAIWSILRQFGEFYGHLVM